MLRAAPADATQHHLAMMVTHVLITPVAAVVIVLPMVTVPMMRVSMMVTMVVTMVLAMVAAVLVRRDDGGHRAEDADHGRGGSRVIVAVVVAAAGIGRQRHGSQCNRGRSSNGDCAAQHITHCGFLIHVVPVLGSNADVSKTLRRMSGAANYVFAM